MSTPEYYRSQAAQLRELAEKSRDAEAMRRWLQMALEYERMARLRAESPPMIGSQPEDQPVDQQQSRMKPNRKR